MLSNPIFLNNFKRVISPNTNYLLMESKVEDRIKELAKDPETTDSDVADWLLGKSEKPEQQ